MNLGIVAAFAYGILAIVGGIIGYVQAVRLVRRCQQAEELAGLIVRPGAEVGKALVAVEPIGIKERDVEHHGDHVTGALGGNRAAERVLHRAIGHVHDRHCLACPRILPAIEHLPAGGIEVIHELA